jgi:hypothetical protein
MLYFFLKFIVLDLCLQMWSGVLSYISGDNKVLSYVIALAINGFPVA